MLLFFFFVVCSTPNISITTTTPADSKHNTGGIRSILGEDGVPVKKLTRKMSLVAAGSVKNVQQSVKEAVSATTAARKERRLKAENIVAEKKRSEMKRMEDYQAMINKYKLRSISVSLPDEENVEFRQNIGNTHALDVLRKKRIITHNNKWLKVWEMCIMLLVLWQAIYVPAILAFEPILPFDMWAFDKVVDIMFIIDFMLQFNVARKSPEGALPSSRREVADIYLRSGTPMGTWFLIDLSASFPYDWVTQSMADAWSYAYYREQFMLPVGGDDKLSGSVRIVKILRLPRLLRLLKLLRLLTEYSQ